MCLAVLQNDKNVCILTYWSTSLETPWRAAEKKLLRINLLLDEPSNLQIFVLPYLHCHIRVFNKVLSRWQKLWSRQ